MGQYIVDFVCYRARLVIEVDGGQHAERAALDEWRSEYLRSLGFAVIRFWNNEVLQQTDFVEEAISELLVQRLRTPSPQCSP